MNEFTLSVASTKRGVPLREKFNYNLQTQSMEFMDGDEVMLLTETLTIDTLYLGTHKMVPYATRFLDVAYKSPSFSVLVDYKSKRANRGKSGAMNIKTQAGGVENVQLSYLKGNPLNRDQKNLEVWDYIPENSYMLYRRNKLQSFRNKKTLTKIFPEKAAFIERYIKENKLNFNNPEEVVSLVKVCMGE